MLPGPARLNPGACYWARGGCRGTADGAPALSLPGSIGPCSQFMRSSLFSPQNGQGAPSLFFPAHAPRDRTFFLWEEDFLPLGNNLFLRREVLPEV